MRHVKAFTYQPKIEGVRSGKITQTIRKPGKRSVKVGDTITFHGWSGKPYRSPWSWRIEVEVTCVVNPILREEGIIAEYGPFMYSWDSETVDGLARNDGIDPPTGKELKRVLKSLNKDWEGTYQIIKWRIRDRGEKDQKEDG